MSSTRNKRKRAETDSRSVGRPKSREQRDAAPSSGQKSGGKIVTVKTQNSNDSATNSGTANEDDSTTVATGTRQQHAIATDVLLKTQSVAVGDSSNPTANNHATRQKGSLSLNNGSSAKPPKPLHSPEIPSSSDRSKGDLAQATSRSELLKGLLTHRLSLRNRIRYCAAAARERLREEIGESSISNSDLTKLKSGDGNEVSLFVEMTTSATITAKRIRSENDANSDRRSSLSLRRGSSVGKRMNAALSSLAPGSSTTSHSPSNPSVVENNSTKDALNEKGKKTVGCMPVEKTRVRSNSSVPPTLPPSNVQVRGTNTANANENTIPIPTPRRQSKHDKPSSTDARSMKGKNIDGKGIAAVKTSIFLDIQLTSNRQSSSTDANRVALPMHLKVVTESLPQNKLAGHNVFSSKTTTLRKRRDAIEARLNTYREQTRQKVLGVPAKNGSFQYRSLHRHKTVVLPHRKMTHWDVLLQEMSWMATDFIEERKWKQSASRNISSAVVSLSEMFSSTSRLTGIENMKRLDGTSREISNKSIHKSTQPGTGTETETEKKLERLSTCTKLKEITMQAYPANSLDCYEATRKVGRSISRLMTKLGSSMMSTIEKQEFDQKHTHNCKQHIRNERGASVRKYTVPLLSPQNGNSVSTGSRATLTGQKHFSFPEISGQIESLAKMKEQRDRGVSRSDASKSASLSKSQLSREQKDAIDRITNLWNQPIAPGIALSGTPFCGKTHTASFLMWQRRKNGPQILLCPPNSMIKWKYEIERLGDVRVLNYGLSGALSNLGSKGMAVLPSAGDILVCEFELLNQIAAFFETSTDSFGTIAVDCRYPSSFHSLRNSTQNAVRDDNLRTFDDSTGILSNLWWDKLLDLSLHSSAAVLLIEHSAGSSFLQHDSNISPRIKLDIAASRAALLVGPRFFVCVGQRIQRRVLSWARHCGKLEGKQKSAKAKEALDKVTACLTISLPSSSWSNEKMRWGLHRCKMDRIQRSNYDDCCIQVRGALSCRLAELVERSHGALHSVSTSLMLLREHCIHAEIRGERINHTIPTRLLQNSAQLDSALASSLIKASAKLREMISILRFKCGVNIAEHLRIACDLTGQCMEPSSDTPKKVVILATLPIARKTVSLLLNALGIQHKQPSCAECSQRFHPVSSSQRNSLLFSSQCPQVYSCLNEIPSQGSSAKPLTDIVVASPMCLAGWNQGLGVESTEMMILFDEDWTGRGEYILSVLLSRIQASNFHTRKRCNCIRLICEDTIEETLFATSTHEYAFVESNQWPRDKAGFICLPEKKSEAVQIYKAATNYYMSNSVEFPLLRLTRLRHKLLSSTLLPSRTIPLEVSSASKIQFLPFARNSSRNDAGEVKSEVELIKVLGLEESVASARYIFEPNEEDCTMECSNKPLFLLGSHRAGACHCLDATRQKFCVCSYLRNVFSSNIEHFESTLSQGLKIVQCISSDQPNSTAVIAAPCDSADEKSMVSRKSLFGSSPVVYNQTSCTSVLHFAPQRQQHDEQGLVWQEGAKEGSWQESIKASRRPSLLQEHHNCYSNLFVTTVSSSETSAGYEGFEPLLFFPPLLKGGMPRVAFKTCLTSLPEVIKRKVAPVLPADPPNSKRIRLSELSPSVVPHHNDDHKATLSSSVLSINSSRDVQCQTFTQHSSSLPKQLTPSEISYGFTRLSDFETVNPTRLSDVDFLGQKMAVSKRGQVYPSLDNWEVPEHMLQHSSGGSKSFLDSVIIFVRNPRIQIKGNIGVSGNDSIFAKHSADMQVPALAPFGAENSTGMAGKDGEKRNKKKVQEKIALSHFPQPVSVHSSQAGQAPPDQTTNTLKKLGHRHRLHDVFAARSLSSGLSMFECVPYQAVVAQVEARISVALEKQELCLGGKRGIFTPHLQLEFVVSMTENKNGKQEGQKFLCPSVPARKGDVPMLCSIGPRGGCFSSFKGIMSPSNPKQQLGVNLPMGVKVSQARGEAQQTAWSDNANSLLCDMANRYGLNWILIAKMMQQILRAEIGKDQFYRTNEILWQQSAERCQSHWENILETSESQPTKTNVAFCERTISIRTERENQGLQGIPNCSMPCLSTSVLMGSTCMMGACNWKKGGDNSDQEADGQALSKGGQEPLQRNANQIFSSLITSNVQRRMIPIAIIGVGNVPKQNQTAHSHPSHLQSVQESVTSHWSDGRTELWPLQILDAAEKHYAAARAPSAPPGSHPHGSSSTSPFPQRGHGRPYPRVLSNPTTSTHSAANALPPPPPRLTGPIKVGCPPTHANIAPKKSTPHNGLARASGKSNKRSK